MTETMHVYPINDFVDHDTDGGECPGAPPRNPSPARTAATGGSSPATAWTAASGRSLTTRGRPSR